MEINLSSKRKLGFITGIVPMPTEDPNKLEMWETCNNMIIAWLTNNVSTTIKQSIMYMTSASEIWANLEMRFALTNGSRKYKLNKDLYELKHGTLSVTEFYISLKSVWAELNSLNLLPAIATPNPDVRKLLDIIHTQKEESRLFQFLNGLSDEFNAQRSHILMLNPLPTVETACASLEQEEAQRSLLNTFKPPLTDVMAMYSKTNNSRPCTACKGKGHTAERCWTLVGFPKWHSRYNPSEPNKPRLPQQNSTPRWSKFNAPKLAATTRVQLPDSGTSGLLFSQQQLEQLAQLMQQGPIKNSDSDEELDVHFSGMISGHLSNNSLDWIVDSGASNHMTPCLSLLSNTSSFAQSHSINLPTGDSVVISHTGSVVVMPGITLKNVLCVPTFKHNLLSVQKLVQDNNCEVNFSPTQCIITDKTSKQVVGIAKVSNGLYVLNSNSVASSNSVMLSDPESLWHHRLGHTPLPKLFKIPYLKPLLKNTAHTCLTCPMAKMTKLPFQSSESISPKKFDLVHMDIWGPYKVPYQSKYRFFLTLVDDHTRYYWVYLLK
ncbi:hypothetical protein AgCh_003257 [Apium graveolens]